MIIAARQMMDARRGSTTIMFAAFAAFLTFGVMMINRAGSTKMVAFVDKQFAPRY